MKSPASARVSDTVAKINGEVAVGENLAFQRRWWRFERIVWFLFAGVIVLDLGGALGRGPLAQAEMRSDDGAFSVRYERIERTGTPSMLNITLQRSAFVDGVVTIHVSDTLAGALGAQRVIPQPANTLIGDGGLTYTFPGRRAPAQVRIELQPSAPGVYPLELDVPGRAPLRANVWVVP